MLKFGYASFQVFSTHRMQFFSSTFEYFSMKKGASGIAHDAHIGGAIFGILFVLLIDADKGVKFLEIFI